MGLKILLTRPDVREKEKRVMKRLATAFSLVLVFSSFAMSQNFSGTYVFESEEGDTLLSVQQDSQGKVRGTLKLDDGTTFQLSGDIKNNEAIGVASVQDKSSLFKLRFQGGQLIYTIIAIGPDGKPDLANAQEFPFTRQGGGAAPRAVAATSGPAASGQSFTGNYSIQTENGPMTLSLQQHADGRVTGTMTDTSGGAYNLDGALNVASGMVIGILVAPNGTQAMFKVQPMTNGVGFAFTPMGGDKNASLENAQVFPFTRTGGAPAGGMAPSGGSNPLGGGGNPLAGGGAVSDPFVGTFAGERLTLQLSGGGGNYTGQMQFQGQTFPVSASSPDGRSLNGTFTSGGNSFSFNATLQGPALAFTTSGTTYDLRRSGGQQADPAMPSNPLGGEAPAVAQRVAQGPGGAINDPYMGVSFDPPQGWKYEKRQAIYVMGHMTVPGMIIVMPHSYNSAQEVMASANEPLYQGEDGQLMLTRAPQAVSQNMLVSDFGGVLGGQQAQGRLICMLSPHGGGVLILAGAAAGSYTQQHASLAEGVARSMRFSRPQESPEAQQWAMKLRGRRLVSLKSGGDASYGQAHSWTDRKELYLCSDGSFQGFGSFSGAAGGQGTSALMGDSTGNLTGRWRVSSPGGAPALELQMSTGGKALFQLTTDGSKTFLDGVRVMVVENTVCP
jgi:hypothetical protein